MPTKLFILAASAALVLSACSPQVTNAPASYPDADTATVTGNSAAQGSALGAVASTPFCDLNPERCG